MAVNETIVTGRKFRKLIDAANKQWQRISFWHKASDCEFDDGKTAQTKVGAIDGITSDLSGESETVAASIKCVNQLNSSLVANIYVGDDGKLHKVQGGADSVLPFSGGKASLNVVSGVTESTAVVKSFIPNCDSDYIVIGGRRYGSVCYPTIKDLSGNTIASTMIDQPADHGGAAYTATVNVNRVACTLKKGETYTLNIPAAGSSYKNFVFAIYP